MRWELTATTPPTISTMDTTDTRGRTFTTFSTVLRKRVLRTIPSTIGATTIFRMDSIMADREISIHAPASHQVRSGVTIGARMVVVMVMETDNATSPLAR